jgi:tetratricopeptide (TPR) repeat protein
MARVPVMHSSVGRVCLLLLVLLLLGLGSVPLASAESEWIEIKSPHFSVITDAGERRGREVAIRFEQMRAVFGTLMIKGKVNLPIPLQIVAFRNGKELRQVVPLWHGKPIQVAGLFQGGEDRAFIMLDMSVENPWTVVFHEYAHQLMNGNVGAPIDPWFDEGFAEYFSSIEVDGKQARVGKVPQEEYDVLRQQGTMKIADLLRVQHTSATYNESGDHRTVFYAQSGMLVHYLYDNNLIPKLATYFELKIDKGIPVDEAIQQTFGMNAAQFDKAFHSYLSAGQYRYFALPTPSDIVEKGYNVRPLGPYDSSAVIADIHLHSPDYYDKAAAEFEAILKQDPYNAAAERGLGYVYLRARKFSEAQEYFQRAAKANSTDPRVHYYSALLMNQDSGAHADASEMTRELETAIALDPTFADAYMLLGYASARAGDMPKALANMKKAVSLSPRNLNYRFNLAQMYLTNRQADEGIAIFRALTKSSDPIIAQRAQDSLAQAEEFKAAMQAVRAAPVIVQGEAPNNVNHEALMESTRIEKTAANQAPVPAPVPIKFLKGTVRSVDCSSSPAAILTVDSGNQAWTMKVPDSQHVLLLGADSFSCEWKKQKVAINYREIGNATGTVVSIEVQ